MSGGGGSAQGYLACGARLAPTSTRVSDQLHAMVKLAARGLGPLGRIPVPQHVWDQWANLEDGRVGDEVRQLPVSCSPKVATLLSTLHELGVIDLAHDPANAEVFVKWKSELDALSLSVNMHMHMFGKGCKFIARPFKLRSL